MRSIKLAVLLSLAFLLVGASVRSHVTNVDSSKPSSTSWFTADGAQAGPRSVAGSGWRTATVPRSVA